MRRYAQSYARTGTYPALAVLLLAAWVPEAAAQIAVSEARAASVTGRAMLTTGNGIPAFALTPGYVLNPGDQIDTRGGGRVAIDLSDGSMVVVLPGSVLILKDYRDASSARELFNILLGRVRVKINHLAGKPNPYRMNSPTASIAVRGTEFGITVDSQGATEVDVYEGAVEVTSLSDPDHKVLIEAGRAVLVQAGQDFHLLTSPQQQQGDRDSDHDNGQTHRNIAMNSPSAAPAPASHPVTPAGAMPIGTPAAMPPGPVSQGLPIAPPGPTGPPPGTRPDHEEDSPRTTAGTYERYIAGLSQIGQIPFLMRFNAFPESHLDSLENPAYATNFTSAEGRLFFLPSLSGIEELGENASFSPAGDQPANWSLSPQLTMFAPIPGSRFVVGGSVTGSRLGSGVSSSSPDYDSGVLGQSEGVNDLHTTGSSSSNFVSGSILAARRFGADGRTSLGFEIEKLAGNGSLSSTTTDPDAPGQGTAENILSRSSISQTRMTLGFSQDLTARHKLGVYYRYALIHATDRNTSDLVNGYAISPLDATGSTGHSSELGMRLRGELSRRLFYGFNAAWLGLSLQDGLKRAITVDSHQRDGAMRGTAGVGLGYFLGQKTVLSFDVAGALSQANAIRFADQTGSLLQTSDSHTRFFSAHTAIQTDVTRRLFLSASLITVWQTNKQAFTVLPDASGELAPIGTPLFPLNPLAYQPTAHFSDYGAGWRFSPDVFVQYVFSTDYGFSPASHTLMLRYTFHLRKE